MSKTFRAIEKEIQEEFFNELLAHIYDKKLSKHPAYLPEVYEAAVTLVADFAERKRL